MKKIAVLVNKDFEYAGFIEGLRDTVQVYAGTNGRDAECYFGNLIADIYCIHNLFKEGENSSNSEVKYKHLKDLFKCNSFRLDECDGILSFSTSESTPFTEGKDEYAKSCNGRVYVGNTFFLSDQRNFDKTTESHLSIGTKNTNYTEEYTKHQLCNGLFDAINEKEMPLKNAYINSAEKLICRANTTFASVGVVNVMDYSCYKNADENAYAQFDAFDSFPVGIETTHGVVVKALNDAIDEMPDKANEIPTKIDIPVNFISPIVDRYLKFDEDVDGKYGKQNFICSYNGGVVTGYILKYLNYIM